MAGIHQLWTFDPATGAVEVAAGTTNEGLLDGPLAEAWFAQTSGLAADGDRLWLVDAETSSLRYVEDGEVHTAVGQGLFDFGFRDGPAGAGAAPAPARRAVLPDGSVAVSDTYNGALRRYDPATGEVTTLASGLAEPSAAYVDGSELVVVESTAHRLTRVPLGAAAPAHRRLQPHHPAPGHRCRGELELVVAFTPPPGQKVDDRFGPPSQLVVEATPPALLRDGEGRGTELTRRLVLDPAVGEGVLHVAARAASCDIGRWRTGRPATSTSRTGASRSGSPPTPSGVLDAAARRSRDAWATATTWSPIRRPPRGGASHQLRATSWRRRRRRGHCATRPRARHASQRDRPCAQNDCDLRRLLPDPDVPGGRPVRRLDSRTSAMYPRLRAAERRRSATALDRMVEEHHAVHGRTRRTAARPSPWSLLVAGPDAGRWPAYARRSSDLEVTLLEHLA